MRPRVGHIQFLNCLPLYYGLVRNDVLLDIELIKGTPTELNRLLLEGSLDIGPISSLEYARFPDKLLLLPDFTVSSDGEVRSILLFSKFSLEKLNGRPIALTNTSATSQLLLKIILEKGYGIKPEYFVSPPDLGMMLLEADAALLIGDDALRGLINPRGLYVYDLGLEWHKLTNKRMVYAVWAARRDFASQKASLAQEVYHSIKKSLEYSKMHLAEIAKLAAKWEPFSPHFLKEYFQTLNFEFGAEYREGLMEFCRYAQELGYLEKVPCLEFLEINGGVKND